MTSFSWYKKYVSWFGFLGVFIISRFGYLGIPSLFCFGFYLLCLSLECNSSRIFTRIYTQRIAIIWGRQNTLLIYVPMQTLLGIQPKDILITSNVDFVNKGGLSEVFAGLELVKYADYLKKTELFYWQRMERNAQAEVDYVISRKGKIFSIEVKAGTSGSMQSMYKFIELKGCEYGIRTSLEPFSSYEKVKVIPLYALSNKFVQED